MEKTGVFDWYSFDIDEEDEYVRKSEESSNCFVYIYDKFLGLCLNILIVAIALKVGCSFVRHPVTIPLGIDAQWVLNGVLCSLGVLVSANLLVFALEFIQKKAGYGKRFRKLRKIKRLLVLLKWFIYNNYKADYIGSKGTFERFIYESSFQSGIVAVSTFIIITLSTDVFEGIYIKKTLREKIKETGKTEDILKSFQNQCGHVMNGLDSSGPSISYPDLFLIDLAFDSSSDDSHSYGSGTSIGKYSIKPPAVKCAKDALTLAKDTFNHLTGDGERIAHADFKKAFRSSELGEAALAYFDSDNSNFISRNEMRSGVFSCYKNRILLERTVDMARMYVSSIRRIVNGFVSWALLLVFMFIFNAPLHQILATCLSSAILLNFLARSLVDGLIHNMRMLFSHPFDIGDDILLDGENYMVERIGIASCRFRCRNGGSILFDNTKLWSMKMVNLSKAPQKLMIFTFILEMSVSTEKIREFKKLIQRYVVKHSFAFDDHFTLCCNEDAPKGLADIKVDLILRCKQHFGRAKTLVLRTECISFIKTVLKELDLKFKN
ncbi:hypothetical protein ENBRE01_1921 [Enteropsectra breve]|nr:hypothetical protein ENBRE01_1921 [Enteropsectra breve]